MEEEGKVIEVVGKKAKIEFQPLQECKSCHVCNKTSTGLMVMEVDNSIGAKVDDLVVISIPASRTIWQTAVLFLVPIVCLTIGVLFGERWNEMIGMLFGVVFFVVSFGLSYLIMSKRKFVSRIVHISN